LYALLIDGGLDEGMDDMGDDTAASGTNEGDATAAAEKRKGIRRYKFSHDHFPTSVR
jgi:hypothetical protein